MVVEIELTLCSIIQGVALYFLVENARAVVSMGQVSAWPYVATGLIIILLFFFNVAGAVAIHLRPDFFLGRGGHYFLIGAQGIGLVGYLIYVIRTYIRFQPLITQTREEWRAASDQTAR